MSEDLLAAALNEASSNFECGVEALTNSSNSRNENNFYVLNTIDVFPYNTIHIKVQNDIRKKNPKLKRNELYVKFDKESASFTDSYNSWKGIMKNFGQKNPFLHLSKYFEKNGSVDIWSQSGHDLYFWELKPKSYEVFPKRAEGLEQLYKYILFPKEKIGGNLGSPDSYSYNVGNNSFLNTPSSDLFFLHINPQNEKVRYDVNYRAYDDGLIIYSFKRTVLPQEEKTAEEPAEESTKEKVTEPIIEPVTEPDPQPAIDKTIVIEKATIAGVCVIGAGAIIWLEKHAKQSSLAGLIPKLEAGVAAAAVVQANGITVLNAAGEECIEVENNEQNEWYISNIYDAYEILETLEIDDIDYSEDNDDELNERLKEKKKEYDEAEKQNPPRDPLIIHLGNSDIIELTTLDNGVNFDLDNNGFDEKTAWIGSDEGFLALDINHNNIIDNGSELFGDRFNGKKYENGFEALAELNENDDFVIDENDKTTYSELLVWIDKNHNGKSENEEIKTLKELGIVSIGLVPESDGIVHIESNILEAESALVTFINGRTRKISEFWFPVNTVDTTHDGTDTVGNVPDFKQALENDFEGILTELFDKFANETDVGRKRYYLKKILYYITNSYDIDPQSRGGNIDARDLHVIEQFMGTEFEGVGGKNPNSNAAETLKKIYASIEDIYYDKVNLYTDFYGISRFISVHDDDFNGCKYVNFDIYGISTNIYSNNYEVFTYDFSKFLKYLDNRYQTSSFEEFVDTYTGITESFNNIITLINNTKTVISSQNSDEVNGSDDYDFLFGEDTNDILNGFSGNDRLYGGGGNDTLKGGAGDDTYIIEMSHGNDIIYDAEGENVISFADYFNEEDYNISISPKLGFVMTNIETNETISIPDFIQNPLAYRFTFHGIDAAFSGGRDSKDVITGTDSDDNLEAGDGFNIFYGCDGNDTIEGGKDMDFMYGGDGDDTLLGRNGVNVLFGEDGSDTIYDGDDGSYLSGGECDDFIYGGGGADVLDGGIGNDYLQGDHGDDTYIFRKGYDTDTINASSDNNTIIIYGYRPTQMINTRNAHNDLIIHFITENSKDCLIIDHFFDFNSNRDIKFVFDNGTILEQNDITAKSEPIFGTNDNDYLMGTDGSDTIDGGEGNDNLCGSNGEDTYIFAKSYGNDTVNEWGSDHSFVELKGIASDEITVSNQWGSNLVISLNDTEDTLVISNFKWGQATYTFKFADGAEGYVDKNTWELILTKEPDVIIEEIVEETNETPQNDDENAFGMEALASTDETSTNETVSIDSTTELL